MVMLGHQFSLPCRVELQRKTSSCCAFIEEKAPRKQDKRKRETETKSYCSQCEKELQWKRKARRGKRQECWEGLVGRADCQ